MSWTNEGWRKAAHDYHAGRKHGRHQGITHMDFEREKPDAEIIPLGKHCEQQQEARPPAFSDDALALRFIDQHKDVLRYVPSLGKWLRWDGKRWCFDDRLIAYDRMRRVCRAAAAECNQPKLAKLVVECLGGLEAMAIIPVALPLQRSRAVRSPQRPSIMSLTSWAGSQGPLMFNHAVLRRPASCFGRRIRSRLPRRQLPCQAHTQGSNAHFRVSLRNRKS